MTGHNSNIEFLPLPTNPKFIDITGQVFTYLTVLGIVAFAKRNRAIWLCQCQCGNQIRALASSLKNLRGTKSCGCWHRAKLVEFNSTHRLSRLPEYILWKGMRGRCSNPNNTSYKHYGGRGITLCDRWNDFSVFLNDMGSRPSTDHTIERIDNNAGYSPENCKWDSRTAQNRNKRTTLQITYQDRTQPLASWCEELGLKYTIVYTRIHRGWTPERAFTT